MWGAGRSAGRGARGGARGVWDARRIHTGVSEMKEAVTTNMPNREEQSYLGAGALATARGVLVERARVRVTAVRGVGTCDVSERIVPFGRV